MTNFEIKLPDNLEKYHDYTPEERDPGDDRTNLEFGVKEFCRRYLIGNHYHLFLDGGAYPLYLDQIYTWWSDIPYHLQDVVTDKPEMIIRILTQSTSFYIVANPLNEAHISVSFDVEEDYYQRLKALAAQQGLAIPNAEKVQNIPVKREDYIREWWKLADWTIGHLLNEQLLSADDPSLVEYLAMMPPRPTNAHQNHQE